MIPTLRPLAACTATLCLALTLIAAPAPAAPQPAVILPDAHPRIYLTPTKLNELKARYNSPAYAKMKADMEAYLERCVPPTDMKFLTDATEAQRHFYWRLPLLALHYNLTGEESSKETALEYIKLIIDLPHWETTKERDGGMGAANVLMGAALTYDWLYNDLEPAFREKLRKKVFAQSLAMWNDGHQRGNPGGLYYWQNDPQNNHRWHRLGGFAPGVLVSVGNAPEELELLANLKSELDLLAGGLSPDGSSHESPSYLVFGISHLLLGFDAADQLLGTHYLTETAFFREVGNYRIHTITPGFTDAFQYGDSGGLSSYNEAFFRIADVQGDKELQTVLNRLVEASPDAASTLWTDFLWKNPKLGEVPLDSIAQEALFPDIGVATMRDGWGIDNVALMFKCGLMGGERLNQWRESRGHTNINVAHDDPDANSFIIWADGGFVVETDRYSYNKRSSSHNTVLVNGKGQHPKGEPEGQHWSQPAADGIPMDRSTRIVNWQVMGDLIVVEGEAAEAYAESPLQRYRRTVVWSEGNYVLVIDDLRASEASDFTWLMQGVKLTGSDGSYLLENGEAKCKFQLLSSKPLKQEIGVSTAELRHKSLNRQQLQATANGEDLRIVSLFLPWGGDYGLKSDFQGPERINITIESKDARDTWRWIAAKDAKSASTLRLTRKQGGDVDVYVIGDGK